MGRLLLWCSRDLVIHFTWKSEEFLFDGYSWWSEIIVFVSSRCSFNSSGVRVYQFLNTKVILVIQDWSMWRLMYWHPFSQPIRCVSCLYSWIDLHYHQFDQFSWLWWLQMITWLKSFHVWPKHYLIDVMVILSWLQNWSKKLQNWISQIQGKQWMILVISVTFLYGISESHQ